MNPLSQWLKINSNPNVLIKESADYCCSTLINLLKLKSIILSAFQQRDVCAADLCSSSVSLTIVHDLTGIMSEKCKVQTSVSVYLHL